MGTADKLYDVKDILHKATTGWITPPNKPGMIVETRSVTYAGIIHQTVTDGAIFTHMKYDFTREKISLTYENRIWTFDISIIAQSMALLQPMFDQAREVFDRYTSSPWSTATLGTGTTYDYAGIEKASHPHKMHDGRVTTTHTLDCVVTLAELGVPVVIA